MDAFSLIQHFFTRMNCNFCNCSFQPEDIQLIRQEDGIYIVNVYCNRCQTQNGVAMVGVETGEEAGIPQYPGFEDPELTEDELERLGDYHPVNYNDVLDAHQFFQNLDENWTQFIPEEIRERCISSGTESPVE